jgi:hypothetical protein
VTETLAVGLSVVAAVGAVIATGAALLVESRRQRAGLKAEPPSSTHHVRVEINSSVFEVNSSTRLTKDELANLFETAVAAEGREAGGQPQGQP